MTTKSRHCEICKRIEHPLPLSLSALWSNRPGGIIQLRADAQPLPSL